MQSYAKCYAKSGFAPSEQEHCSSGRRHVLEYGLQDGEANRAGYIYYTYYIYYTH